MADDQDKKEQKEKQEPKETAAKAKDKSKETSGFSLFTWLILAAIIVAGAAGGFALSQLIAGPVQADTDPEAQQTEEVNTFEQLLAKTGENDKYWSYDLEPVVANLDEPGVTRYVRATITLELSPEIAQEAGEVFLEEKKPVLVDWLTTYLAGLSLERVRGTSNLSRIKKEIRDHFNEMLFPESKPFVHRILFKEFAVQ